MNQSPSILMPAQTVRRMPIKLLGKMYEVFGGPWVSKPADVRGVCMAAEKQISAYDVKVTIPDFQVPKKEDFLFGLKVALAWLLSGQEVYVGCGAGQGRTGLMMAAIAKVSIADSVIGRSYRPGQINPIAYVRMFYNNHAVETEAQARYIQHLNVTQIVEELPRLEKFVRLVR